MFKMLLGVAIAGVAAVHAADYELDEGVIIGTDDNLAAIIQESEFVMVEFYAPWCGHCKSLAPEYVQAAAALADAGSTAKLVKVDATEQTAVAETYSVEGYPTIKFFKNGQESDFNGGRTSDEIVAWVTKKSGPAAIPCVTVEECTTLKEAHPIAAVGFFDATDSAAYIRFTEAADASEQIFIVTTSADVATHFKAALVDGGAIHVYTDFDEGLFIFEKASWDVESINNFVGGSALPLVTEFSEETAPKIFGGDLKSHCLFFESFTSETWEENRKAFTAAAKDFKGRALFITLDVDKPDNGRILEFFGITAEQTPTYRVINVTENMEKFAPPTSETTEAAISAFVGGYLDGTVKPHVNTEEIPDDWDAKPVKVLVGKNFEEVALDTTKDVFVEFYAPWCGHCKSLAPIFDQLGEAFESSGVVVAKMDSTSNDAAGITVESFPTLKLFPKGDAAEVIDFDGDRELLSMAEFLVEKTGVAMPTLPESEAAPEGEDASTEGTGAGPDGHEEGHDEL